MKYRTAPSPGAVESWPREKREADMAAVCPQADSPFRWYHRAGAGLLNPALVSREKLHNPITWYLLRRLRIGLGPLVVQVLWLLLALCDAALLLTAWETGSAAVLHHAALVHLTVVPLLVGAGMQAGAVATVRGFTARVGIEQLLTTRLRPGDLLHAFAARQMLMHGAGLLLASLLVGAGVAAYAVAMQRVKGVAPDHATVMMGVFVLLRHYTLRIHLEHGLVSGLHAALFFGEEGKLRGRLAAALLWPYGLLQLLLPPSMVLAIGWIRSTGSLELTLLAMVVFVFALVMIPSYTSTMTTRLFRECEERMNRWWIFEGR